MRTTKFRAWDLINKKMFIPNGIDLKNNRVRFVDGDYIVNAKIDDEVLLLEYTGFKDKNGEEIFDGHILYNPHDRHPYYVVVNVYGGGFSLQHPKHIDIFSIAEDLSRYRFGEFWEVVGNIYENPELLESAR